MDVPNYKDVVMDSLQEILQRLESIEKRLDTFPAVTHECTTRKRRLDSSVYADISALRPAKCRKACTFIDATSDDLQRAADSFAQSEHTSSELWSLLSDMAKSENSKEAAERIFYRWVGPYVRWSKGLIVEGKHMITTRPADIYSLVARLKQYNLSPVVLASHDKGCIYYVPLVTFEKLYEITGEDFDPSNVTGMTQCIQNGAGV